VPLYKRKYLMYKRSCFMVMNETFSFNFEVFPLTCAEVDSSCRVDSSCLCFSFHILETIA